jgi:hypothetical protein
MRAFVFLKAAEKAFPLRSQSFEPLNGGDWFLEERYLSAHM